MRVERIVFLQGEEARPVLELLDEQGQGAAVEHLQQWFNPGEHEVSHCLAAGTHDRTFHDGKGFTLTWNDGLEYIGLEFAHK
jgi:hypothetical protein